MNGERILLDTKAVIALLRGHEQLSKRLAVAEWVGISIVTWIEFRSFPDLNEEDALLFSEACSRLEIVGLTIEEGRLPDLVVQLRTEKLLKTPDAVILATAIHRDAILLTQDRRLLGTQSPSVQTF